MNRFIYFVGLSTIFLPINITVATVGSKPVDIVLSDFLFLFLIPVFIYFTKRRQSLHVVYFSIVLLVYILFCLASILLYQIDAESGLVAIASFLRSLRAFFLFYIGYYYYSRLGDQIYSWSVLISIILVFSLLISDVLYNIAWPSPRWGGYLYGLEVYGFPNSPAFFYVVVLAVLLYAVSYERKYSLLSYIALFGMVAIVVLTGSRNAIGCLAMLLFLLVTMRLLSYKYALFMVPVLAAGGYYFANSDIDMYLLTSKFQRSFSEGFLYGREDVWKDVISIVIERPLMGYGYDPLTDNYEHYGTAHNQYIEYLYKMGFLGFLFISSLWWAVIKPVWEAGFRGPDSGRNFFMKFIFAGFIVSLFSNFFQPNLTYSITQAFYCFFGGVAASMLSTDREKIGKIR